MLICIVSRTHRVYKGGEISKRSATLCGLTSATEGFLAVASAREIAKLKARKVIDQCGFRMMGPTRLAGWSALAGL